MSAEPSLLVNAAHDPGYTTVGFSRDGKKIYTAGYDEVVRVWDASRGSSQEPKVIQDADKPVTSVDCTPNSWLSASQDGLVRKYNVATDEKEDDIYNATGASIRCIAVSPDGAHFAIASEELTVKVISISDIGNVMVLGEHKRGVRAVSWSPDGSIITTTAQDGNIYVWSQPSGQWSLITTIPGIVPAVHDDGSSEFNHNSAAVWHPNGRYFLVPTKSHDIAVVSTEIWDSMGLFDAGKVLGSAVTSLAFSLNGKYLASAAADGQVLIWDTSSRKVLSRTQTRNKSLITNITFSPSENALAWTDIDGMLTRWSDVMPTSSAATAEVSRTQRKVPGNSRDDDEDALDDVGEDVADGADMDEYKDDWIIDDGTGVNYKDPEPSGHDHIGLREMVNVTKAQPAFQSGSTPFRNKKRYLALNMLGVIEVTDQDTHHVVNVEFHDKSLRRGYHFQDHFRYHLASLGPRGALYACAPEGTNPAQVHYRPYETWASAPDWQMPLPAGEVPVAVCTGGAPLSRKSNDPSREETTGGPTDAGGAGYAAVATSPGLIRFWLGTGIQTYLWHLGGEVVAMEAGAEWVFVIHRDGGTSLDGCQNLKYSLMALDSYDIINAGPVPLGKGVTLKWIGITSEGAPAIYDSKGLLSILDRFRRPTQGRWIITLDTNVLERRIGKDESYWPVGLSSKEFMCIILKGRQQHPDFPRPVIQELEVRMPLLNTDVSQGQSEEKVLREKIRITMLRDALPPSMSTTGEIEQQAVALDKVIMQLIQTSCKADKLERALDYTWMLHNLASFDGAQKIAEFYHLPGLREKIAALKEFRMENEDDVERDVRSGWGRIQDPVPRASMIHFDNLSYANGRDIERAARTSDTFAPAPTVSRRSLAAASSTVPEPLPVSLSMPSSPPPSTAEAYYGDELVVESNSESLMKRKRNDYGTDGQSSTLLASPRKKASLSSRNNVPPPASSKNPFARKKIADGGPLSSPFPRRGGQSINAVKSNSFFDKVDAAESEVAAPSRSKDGAKKDGGRQSTLFGLPPPHLAANPGKKGKGDPVAGSERPTARGTEKSKLSSENKRFSGDNGAAESETQPIEESQETEPNSQVGEETMGTEMEERQGSPDWELPEGEDPEKD